MLEATLTVLLAIACVLAVQVSILLLTITNIKREELEQITYINNPRASKPTEALMQYELEED